MKVVRTQLSIIGSNQSEVSKMQHQRNIIQPKHQGFGVGIYIRDDRDIDFELDSKIVVDGISQTTTGYFLV